MVNEGVKEVVGDFVEEEENEVENEVVSDFVEEVEREDTIECE